MTTQRVLCRCLGVTEEEVMCAVGALGLRTLREIRDRTGAGTGCMCCHKVLARCLQEQAAPSGIGETK
jgi:NAD(P)H-nitrite reductase large subunit